MSHEVETMFSRDVPWHGLGTTTGKALTSAEAIVAAGLDWTVRKAPIFFKDDARKTHQVPGRFATVRSTDEVALGVVGRDFVPLQNTESFQVLDDLVGEGELLFDSAGSLRGGQVVWVAAKLPEGIQLLGHENLDLYAILSHGHDGTRSIEVMFTPILTVCMNTLTLGRSVAKSRFAVAHRANAKARLAQAAQLLTGITDYGQTMQRIAEELAATEMELADLDSWLDTLYEDIRDKEPKRAETHAKGTLATWTGSTNIRDEVRLTGWGAYNAVTEYWDHTRARAESTPEGRVRSIWEGTGRHYRDRALQMLVK